MGAGELDARIAAARHTISPVGRLRDGVSAAEATRGSQRDRARTSCGASTEQGDYLLADAAAVPLQTSSPAAWARRSTSCSAPCSFCCSSPARTSTNLLLAQAARARRELAIRHALGAGRGALMRQFIAESLLLLAMGCPAGLLVASLGVRALLALAPADLPRSTTSR